MSYTEILDATTQRIKTQFNRHATLAIGTGSVLAAQTQAVIPLPPFSCIVICGSSVLPLSTFFTKQCSWPFQWPKILHFLLVSHLR